MKYEKELLDLAERQTTGKNEGKISKDEVMDLIASAKDGVKVTEIELATLKYIRSEFPFTDAAATLFEIEVAKL